MISLFRADRSESSDQENSTFRQTRNSPQHPKSWPLSRFPVWSPTFSTASSHSPILSLFFDSAQETRVSGGSILLNLIRILHFLPFSSARLNTCVTARAESPTTPPYFLPSFLNAPFIPCSAINDLSPRLLRLARREKEKEIGRIPQVRAHFLFRFNHGSHFAFFSHFAGEEESFVPGSFSSSICEHGTRSSRV